MIKDRMCHVLWSERKTEKTVLYRQLMQLTLISSNQVDLKMINSLGHDYNSVVQKKLCFSLV